MQFGDFPDSFRDYTASRVVLLPVPFDKTCSWQKGAANGPSALLEASYYLENYCIETGAEVYREGIHTAPAVLAETSEQMVAEVERRVEELLADGKFVVTLGGEHTVAVGAVRAAARKYPRMSVLQLDAHADLRDEYEGSRLSHACTMARIRESVADTVAVGIRSLDIKERELLDSAATFYAHHLHDDSGWSDKVVDRLRDEVYVTIDLDVFDPSLLPATGTPEPGGLDWYQATGLLREVARRRRVVGFDVTELSPMGHKPSEFLAAKLVQNSLSYISAFRA